MCRFVIKYIHSDVKPLDPKSSVAVQSHTAAESCEDVTPDSMHLQLVLPVFCSCTYSCTHTDCERGRLSIPALVPAVHGCV